MSKVSQLAPLNVEEQQLYSESVLNDCRRGCSVSITAAMALLHPLIPCSSLPSSVNKTPRYLYSCSIPGAATRPDPEWELHPFPVENDGLKLRAANSHKLGFCVVFVEEGSHNLLSGLQSKPMQPLLRPLPLARGYCQTF